MPRPPLVVDHVVRMSLQGATLDDHWAVVLDVGVVENQIPAPSRPSAIRQSLDRVWDAWADHIMPLLSNTCSLDEIRWTDLSSADGATGLRTGTNSNPGSISGGATGDPAASGLAVLVTKVTDDSARGVRSGRMFLPGLSEGEITGNNLTDPDFATFVTYLGDFLTAATHTASDDDVQTDLRVVHVPRVGAPFSNKITGLVPRKKLSHQIRRMDA